MLRFDEARVKLVTEHRKVGGFLDAEETDLSRHIDSCARRAHVLVMMMDRRTPQEAIRGKVNALLFWDARSLL